MLGSLINNLATLRRRSRTFRKQCRMGFRHKFWPIHPILKSYKTMRDFADCLAANKRNKGGSMHYLRVNHGLLFRSGLVLLFVLWANGCGHEAKEEKEESAGEYVKISCADRTVDVDPT